MVKYEELARYLTNCPLCKSNAGFRISGFPFKNSFECKSCGAKWQWRDAGNVVLKKSSKDGTGSFLLEVERPSSFWNNLDLKQIDWKKVPKPGSIILHSLVLRNGEEVLASWNGQYYSLGSLVLTTQGLLWLDKKEEGIFKKRVNYHLDHILMLEDILQIVSSPFGYGYLNTEDVEIISKQGKKYSYRLTRMQEYPSCKFLLSKAIEQRKKEIKSLKRKERVQILLDFSSLKDYMQKGGLTVQTFRCPDCNAPVEFPERGETTECSHCGSKIYARDIFEKIKELIG